MKDRKLKTSAESHYNKVWRSDECHREFVVIVGYLEHQVEFGAHILGFRSTLQTFKTIEYEVHRTNIEEDMTLLFSNPNPRLSFVVDSFVCSSELEVRCVLKIKVVESPPLLVQ